MKKMTTGLHAIMISSGNITPITYAIVQWLKKHPGKSFMFKDIPIDFSGDWHKTIHRLRCWDLIEVTKKIQRGNQYDGKELLRKYIEWEKSHDINDYI